MSQSADMAMSQNRREPITSGLFYPSSKEELKERVDSYLKGERGSSPALIIPHASYDMVGSLCGKAWQRGSERKVDRILLLGPVHREPEKGLIFPQSDYFASPLGDIPLDREIIEELNKSSCLMKIDQTPHEEEHCLELTLPFISLLFPGAKIIPCLAGDHGKKELKAMAEILKHSLEDRKDSLLTVITTNMSSFDQEKKAEEEAGNFLNWVNDPSGEPAKVKGCGAHLISLYKLMDLYKGGFQSIEQTRITRKEGKSLKALYYGTFFQNTGI